MVYANSKRPTPDAIDGPHPERRTRGVAVPERPDADQSGDNTPDQQGIEIDNAIERPQDGEPGEPGAR